MACVAEYRLWVWVLSTNDQPTNHYELSFEGFLGRASLWLPWQGRNYHITLFAEREPPQNLVFFFFMFCNSTPNYFGVVGKCSFKMKIHHV